MIRVWSEHLPLGELRAPTTVRLLTAEAVHPVVAVSPTTSPAELAQTILTYLDAGLEPGIWPLLSQEDGYWPGERNIEQWAQIAHQWLDELSARGAMPPWLAADLEPPFGQTAHLLRRTWTAPFAAARMGLENMNVERFEAAEFALSSAVAALQARGVSVLGVTLPMAAHDLRDGEPFWQDMFETPWAGIAWDAAGIMAYGSIVSGASRGLLSPADARAIHQRLLQRVGRSFGPRAHASIGITGTGVFGDEPAYDDIEELALDASAARAAGIDDLGIFCLEGLLHRDSPERWLRAVTRSQPHLPRETWKSTASRHLAAVVRGSARRVFAR